MKNFTKALNDLSNENVEIYEDSIRNAIIRAIFKNSTFLDKKPVIKGLTVLNEIFFGKTLKILSNSPQSKEKFSEYVNSYLFDLSLKYNKNFIIQIYSINCFKEKAHETLNKSSIQFNLDIPKKKYNKELLNYYMNVKLSTSLQEKYLSYYHVLEIFLKMFILLCNLILYLRFSINIKVHY